MVGSSPLARGLLLLRALSVRTVRIIPARAGFTAPADLAAPMKTDHPRSRGVYSRRLSAMTKKSGSSPLARGLQPLVLGVAHSVGIIPARAGFT